MYHIDSVFSKKSIVEFYYYLSNNKISNQQLNYIISQLIDNNIITKNFNKENYNEKIVIQQMYLLFLINMSDKFWRNNYNNYLLLKKHVECNIVWIEDVFISKYVISHFLLLENQNLMILNDNLINQLNLWIEDDNSSSYNSVFATLNEAISIIKNGGHVTFNSVVINTLDKFKEIIKVKLKNYRFILSNLDL